MIQKPKVIITHWVHPEVIDFLSPHCELVLNQTGESLPRDELVYLTKDAEALMVFMPDSIDEDFLRTCQKLKIVAGALKGFDNFDVDAANADFVGTGLIFHATVIGSIVRIRFGIRRLGRVIRPRLEYHHGFAIEVRVLEELRSLLEVHDGEVELAIVFADTRAAPDDLLEFDHGVHRTHQHNVADIPGIDAGGEFL